METAPVRLAPRWAVVVVGAMGPLLCLVGAAMLGLGDGTDRWVGGAYLVLGVAATVVALVMFWPRRLRADLSGDFEVAAPVALVGAVLAIWAAGLVVAALLAVAVVRDGPNAVESPGAALVLVVAALASIPDLVRLATGRLHRPRLVVDAEGVRYRGYRTSEHVPWSQVRGVHLQASRLFRWHGVPASMRPDEGGARGYGVVVERKGGRRDLLVRQAPFRVPAEQLAAAIGKRAR